MVKKLYGAFGQGDIETIVTILPIDRFGNLKALP